ncbi:MAG: hypothetical protein ABI624_18235 [Casimicrobiaceae bacterium]
MKRALLASMLVTLWVTSVVTASSACAADLPADLKLISGSPARSAADIAAQNVLQLNKTMFELYGDAGKIFSTNIRDHHPIILGLFSGAGGRFILYRPGMPPMDAPSVPVVYQYLKSVGHSTMAVSEVALPYLDNPADVSWKASMLAYRSRMQSALDTLDALPMQADWRETNATILRNNIAYMDECVAKGVISYAALQEFSKKQAPLLALIVKWAAETQVAHWMGVLADWKKLLGADWSKVYAMSNTIYVARQNNVIFSVLAQFMGPEAINDRLMLIETVSFTTTPEDMLESLTRIVADRSVGLLFFGSYHLMDFELMGGNGRAAIVAESAKRGMTPFLPPVVPFGSTQWPTLITPGPGPGTIADLLK